MKILHYIPDFGEVTESQCHMMLRMITATSGQAQVCLATSAQLTTAMTEQLQKTYSVQLLQLTPMKLSAKKPLLWVKAYKEMKSVLTLQQPDIVHIHGSWNPLLAMMERIAHRDGFVTCLSTYGGMSPEIINIDFFKKRFLPLVTYQGPMIRHASSLIVLNEKEWKDVRAYKKRVEILPSMDTRNYGSTAARVTVDPELRNAVDPFSIALLAAYQKAIDSSYRRFLSPDEESLVERCFFAATQLDDNATGYTATDTQPLSLRNIFFLAYDEDIMPQVRDGANRLGINLPQPPDIANIPRYADRKAKRRGVIRELPLPKRRLRIPDTKIDEYQVVASILRVQKEGLKRLTYRHKSELYHLFRELDFDEDVVANELARLHLKSFTLKVQKMLHEMYNMPSGYDIF